MSAVRKSLTVGAVAVTALAVTGTAVGATHYIITRLSQISPSVVKQLRGATGPRGPAGPAGQGSAYVANGSVDTLATTATTVVTLVLPKAPALIQASAVVTNSGTPSDAQATCVINLDGKAIAPAVTIDAPAELTPLNNAGTGTATLFATAATPGKLTLTCLDVGGATTLSAQGTMSALTVATATTFAAPSPSASASSTASPSASPSPTGSSSASPSATPTPTPTTSSSPSPSNSLIPTPPVGH
jgi:hypothetical protein